MATTPYDNKLNQIFFPSNVEKQKGTSCSFGFNSLSLSHSLAHPLTHTHTHKNYLSYSHTHTPTLSFGVGLIKEFVAIISRSIVAASAGIKV